MKYRGPSWWYWIWHSGARAEREERRRLLMEYAVIAALLLALFLSVYWR